MIRNHGVGSKRVPLASILSTMAQKVRRLRFETILRDLDAVLDLCRSIGLEADVCEGRFFRHHRQYLSDWLARRQGSEEAKRRVEAYTPMAAATAQVEGLELAELLPFLRTQDADCIRPKLRDALAGPVVAVEEDQNSNHARNTMFELLVAAKLWRGGIVPGLGEHPDVRCVVDGRPYLVECKRCLSEKGISRLLRKARSQLTSGMKRARAGTRGVTAIDVSKALNPGDYFLEFADPVRATDALKKELDGRLAPELDEGWAPKIVGVIGYALTAAVHREEAGIVGFEGVNLYFSPKRRGTESAFRSLGGVLAKVADHSA